jgi:hypothetical protein
MKLLNNLNSTTIFISIVSFLNSFSMGIVITSAISFTEVLNVKIFFLVHMRTIGEMSGYFGKVIAGIVSDYVKDRRTFLIIGYGAVLLFKPLFIASTFDCFDLTVRCFMFSVANVLDKFFNAWRDVPRDALIADYTDKEFLSKNLSFRKFMANTGTGLGALLSLLLVYFKISYKQIFIMATIPSLIGFIILYFKVFDRKQTIEEKVNNTPNANLKILILFFIATLFLFVGRLNEMFIINHASLHGYTANISGYLYTIFYAVSPLIFYFISKFNVYNLFNCIRWTILLVTISNILILKNLSYFSIFLTCICHTIHNCILDSLLIANILRMFPNTRWKALLIGLLNTVMGIGCMITLIWTKEISYFFNPDYIFPFSFIPSFIGLSIVYFISRNLK